MSKKGKEGPLPSNVFPIEHARNKVEVTVYCSICNENQIQWIRWNQDIDKIRCMECVNPVSMVYPKGE